MPTAGLGSRLRDELIDALMEAPGADSAAGRTALLTGIPGPVRAALNRADNQFVDLTNIVDQVEKLGRLDNGERPAVIVAHNAWRRCAGTELGRRLAEVESALENAYGGDEPSFDLPAQPEAIVSGGDGEWVDSGFFPRAQRAGAGVARLLVPRYEEGGPASPVGAVGSGWLITTSLLLTNCHVVEARAGTERPATTAEIRAQTAGAEAWFDYHTEGARPTVVRAGELAAVNREMDYAVIRLTPDDALAGRPVPVARHRPELTTGSRLNIVQCPGGGPLRYAIRNNFFVGAGRSKEQIRYLTDTVRGSSGAPVFDDAWQVVAMHRRFRPVDPAPYAHEDGGRRLVKFHNEGILVADILTDLPGELRSEIEDGQGWR
ncbi:serine protease [Actinoplanes sp. NPDC049118]|uniref:trypsin-like serine peptidase n=1 Tax=Actinoplanes sp. NPDC049118 TaxID=3155769 RepID=UPI0033E0D936